MTYLLNDKNTTGMKTNNRIREFSLSFLKKLTKLQFLGLYKNNYMRNIPKEIYDYDGNCLQDVRNYLEALNQDKAIPND